MAASYHHQRPQDRQGCQPKSTVVRYSVRRRHSCHRFVTPAICTISTLTVLVFVAFLSDRLKLRGVMMLFTLPIAIVGYAVIANVASPHVRFGMTCIMAIGRFSCTLHCSVLLADVIKGMYSSVPCVLVWNSNNSAGTLPHKRPWSQALMIDRAL